MTNTTGFTSLVALTLQRDCFVDEQDRLAEYAKSLRVPIQTGEVIKGDQGDKGEKGDKGSSGGRGANGIDGRTPAMTSSDQELDASVDQWTVSNNDLRSKIVNLWYDDVASDPPSLVNIMCMRYTGTDTIVYLDAVTPDDKFRLRITTFV